MNSEELLKWFKETLLPDVVRNGHFSGQGQSQTIEKCEFEEIENYVDSFASLPSFAKLILKSPLGYTSHDILIKFQCQDPLLRAKMKTTLQYFNEVFFYNHIKPQFVEFLRTCGKSDLMEQITPKCYFASYGSGEPEKAIVILEDLRSSGYRLSHSKVYQDLKHCLLSVALLARFHAVSFAMKFRKWAPFDALKSSFLEVYFSDDSENREMYRDFFGRIAQRGIDYLLLQKQLPNVYLENFRQMLLPTFDVCKSLHKPREPLSVICHGDFNRNNILYRYDNGEVTDAKLIDYQRYCYGSPCIDLGLFVYLNTSLEFREKHFDHLFEFYYRTLVKTVSGLVGESTTSIADWIPISIFREDFGRVAAQHYVTVSFFLPILMTPPDDEFEDDMKYKSYLEMGEKNVKTGGESVTRKIADVIVDFYKRGFYR